MTCRRNNGSSSSSPGDNAASVAGQDEGKQGLSQERYPATTKRRTRGEGETVCGTIQRKEEAAATFRDRTRPEKQSAREILIAAPIGRFRVVEDTRHRYPYTGLSALVVKATWAKSSTHRDFCARMAHSSITPGEGG